MSFNKIDNPKQREAEVKKYLSLKEELRLKDKIENMRKHGRREAIQKVFKPITMATEKMEKVISKDIKDMQTELAETIRDNTVKTIVPKYLDTVKDIPEEVKEKPNLDLPIDKELLELVESNLYENPNAIPDLLRYVHNEEDNRVAFYKNNKLLTISDDGIEYEGKKYKKTPELLDLIFSNEPSKESKSNAEAYRDYKEILNDSEVLYKVSTKGLTPNQKLSKKKLKWDSILNDVYQDLKNNKNLKINKKDIEKTIDKIEEKIKENREEFKKNNTAELENKYTTLVKDKATINNLKNKYNQPKTEGKGNDSNNNTVFLSSDPDTLADRLTLLLSSAMNGNTGLRNEMVDICNELIRKKVMNRKERDLLLFDL